MIYTVILSISHVIFSYNKITQETREVDDGYYSPVTVENESKNKSLWTMISSLKNIILNVISLFYK